jgi:hypothetical protein
VLVLSERFGLPDKVIVAEDWLVNCGTEKMNRLTFQAANAFESMPWLP